MGPQRTTEKNEIAAKPQKCGTQVQWYRMGPQRTAEKMRPLQKHKNAERKYSGTAWGRNERPNK